jgi:hypothetical protein
MRSKKPNGKLGPKLIALIEERTKLKAEYAANTAARLRLQHKLDRSTTQLAQMADLESLLDFPQVTPSRLPKPSA